MAILPLHLPLWQKVVLLDSLCFTYANSKWKYANTNIFLACYPTTFFGLSYSINPRVFLVKRFKVKHRHPKIWIYQYSQNAFKLMDEYLFVCLFVWGFSSHSRIFHSYGDVTIASEWLQILNCAWHSWPSSSEGSLARHTYCDEGHPFIMVLSQDPWHSHLLTSV